MAGAIFLVGTSPSDRTFGLHAVPTVLLPETKSFLFLLGKGGTTRTAEL